MKDLQEGKNHDGLELELEVRELELDLEELIEFVR